MDDGLSMPVLKFIMSIENELGKLYFCTALWIVNKDVQLDSTIWSNNFVGATTIEGKGIVYRMKDGTVISHRIRSSSIDKSPVVELKIKAIKEIKSQKIHFTKRDEA